MPIWILIYNLSKIDFCHVANNIHIASRMNSVDYFNLCDLYPTCIQLVLLNQPIDLGYRSVFRPQMTNGFLLMQRLTGYSYSAAVGSS